jgi:plasmid stabilization system protein ParE
METKYKVIWSDNAEQDINEIYAYIYSHFFSETAVRNIRADVVKNIEILKTQPHIFPNSKIQGCRRFMVRDYLFFFEIDEPTKTVNILAVYSGLQDYEKFF